MSLFSSPEEHAANPPESWVIEKRVPIGGKGAPRWYLTIKDGLALDSFSTKKAAEEARTKGFYARLYATEAHWYAGEPIAKLKPWAQVREEQERNAVFQAAFRAAREAL